MRVADAYYAAAVVNASTYGSDVSPIHADAAHGTGRGTMVRLSLLPHRCTLTHAPTKARTPSHGLWSLTPI